MEKAQDQNLPLPAFGADCTNTAVQSGAPRTTQTGIREGESSRFSAEAIAPPPEIDISKRIPLWYPYMFAGAGVAIFLHNRRGWPLYVCFAAIACLQIGPVIVLGAILNKDWDKDWFNSQAARLPPMSRMVRCFYGTLGVCLAVLGAWLLKQILVGSDSGWWNDPIF